jgi:hypothetical protein
VRAVIVVPIRGSTNTWKVAEVSDRPSAVQDRVVTLEIQGNATDGYHLVISPAGCFTAGTWHQSVEDAKEKAAKMFGVPPNGWT